MIFSTLLLLGQLGLVGGARPDFPSFLGPDAASYEKYDHYPPYCSTPEEMETRAVPPLKQGDPASSRLVHVTALIRHGARTPYAAAPDYKCWDGFWDDEETGVWNCDLKTYISPPAATKEKEAVVSNGLLEEDPDFLFEKRYDALTLTTGKTGNLLNGTCEKGQLLTRGYNQELRNGLHLRQAYFFDGKTEDGHAASDPRMRLWDLTGESEGGREASAPAIGDPTKQIFQEPNLRYRADDEQRTLMSGQILLRGLFEEELLATEDDETSVIRLHTADYPVDVLHINHDVCPRTVDLYLEAYESDEYKQWIDTSFEVMAVHNYLKKEMGITEMPGSMLDCMMTTICTDRTLPDSLNNYDGSLGPTPYDDSLLTSGESAGVSGGDWSAMFEHIANVAIKNFTFPYKYNDAAYAKLGMGPLWKEVMANINPIVDAASYPTTGTPPPKLALFSGHDTTLMPMLATLGENVWTGTDWSPYASMIQIEIHEITDSGNGFEFPSGYAFRLIYNGKVLTNKMDGCAAGAELCDSRVLLDQVMPFAKYQERDCVSALDSDDVPPEEEGLVEEMVVATETLVAAPGGVWAITAIVLLSMLFGSALTFFAMKYRSRPYKRGSMVLGDVSMRVIDGEEEKSGIQSAVKYGATHGDENTLI